LFLGSAYESDMRRAGAQVGGLWARGEAVIMSRAGDTAIAAEVQHRRRVAVDVILLLMRNGRILLRERANTGYGDGAYEPPTGQLADRETIVETAIRVASAEVGIAIRAENVSLAHVMHDVSGSGRIAFFLTVSGWQGDYPLSSGGLGGVVPPGASRAPGARWFPVSHLPTNMLDRSRVALRNYAEGMRFSTYPAFGPVGPALFSAAPWQDAFSA
jgi:8-oxo-dGTP diphosphatase